MIHNPKTKRLASLRQHLISWEDASIAARAAIEEFRKSDSKLTPLGRCLSYSAIVSYARPFTRNNGVDTPEVTKNERLHKLRNEIAAHIDGTAHPHLLEVEIKDGRLTPTFKTPLIIQSDMPLMLEELRIGYPLLASEILHLETEINDLNLPDGIYNGPPKTEVPLGYEGQSESPERAG